MPKAMEEVKSDRHPQTRKRLYITKELQTNLTVVSHIQVVRTYDPKPTEPTDRNHDYRTASCFYNNHHITKMTTSILIIICSYNNHHITNMTTSILVTTCSYNNHHITKMATSILVTTCSYNNHHITKMTTSILITTCSYNNHHITKMATICSYNNQVYNRTTTQLDTTH